MTKIKTVFDRILEVLMCSLLVSMVFIAILQIFTRHFLEHPVSFTNEFLKFSLLWFSLLAAAYCFGKKEHLAILFIKEKFKGKLLLALEVFSELTIIVFASTVFVYGGIKGVILGMSEMSPTLFIPIGYIYIVIPISGVFIIFYSLINLINYFIGKDVDKNQEVLHTM